MPNLTTELPKRTGDLETDYNNLYNAFISLVDELKQLLNNLDSGNVTEAASVKAQNIDAAHAKIKDAQIASLTANKLTAGIIDTGEIVIRGEDTSGGSMVLTGNLIVFYDKRGNERVVIGNVDGEIVFTLQSADGKQGVYMDQVGNISITGKLKTTSDGIIGGSIKLGEVANPTIEFLKTSGSVGARIYFDDSQDMIIMEANNIKFNGNIVG